LKYSLLLSLLPLPSPPIVISLTLHSVYKKPYTNSPSIPPLHSPFLHHQLSSLSPSI
jgi:hypothetical protein